MRALKFNGGYINYFVVNREKMPFISTTVQSKLVHRAVCSNDQKLLQKCIDDLKNIAFVSISY